LISRLHPLQPGHAALPRNREDVRERSVSAGGTALQEPGFRVETDSLSHSVRAIGYRLVEADGRQVLTDRLAALGSTGPDDREAVARGPSGHR
jgi:ribonuclease Z